MSPMPRLSGRTDTKNEQHECSVVPFGLTTNAPASFSSMIILRVLDPALDKWVCLLSRLQDQGRAPAASPRRPAGEEQSARETGFRASGVRGSRTNHEGHGIKPTHKRIPLCRVFCPPSFRQHHSLHMDRQTTSCIPSTQTSLPLRLRPHPHRQHRCIQFRRRCSAAAD